MKKHIVFFFLVSISTYAQTTLNADGQSNTYSLINSVLAPSGNVVEVPDCAHPAFGEHIQQAWDAELEDYVFTFYAHTDEDNDRCINYDRQRTEIKTYGSSPNELKGFLGDTVIYRWKFKLDANFKPSPNFTHLHQIKAVGGSQSGMPTITLTARKASPNKLQLIHAETNDQEKITQINLDQVTGQWIQAEETITYGEVGLANYQLLLTQIDSNQIILDYSSQNLRMWKTGANFLRPKWGIYRSLLNASYLRDECVKFADFYIEKIQLANQSQGALKKKKTLIYPIPTKGNLFIETGKEESLSSISIFNMNGQEISTLSYPTNPIDISSLPKGMYLMKVVTSTQNFFQKVIIRD